MSLSFSIITPTYNRASLLKKTGESILNQKYIDFEWIVVDDGSTDDTSRVIELIEDKRIHYYKIKNSERGAARNYGIKNSTGDYITFLDSDDIYYNNYLQNALEFIESNNNPPFFHLAYECVDEEGKVVANYKEFDPEELYKGNFLACIGVFIRRDVTEKELFNEDRRLAGSEDYEYWLRLYAHYDLLISKKVSAAMVFHKDRGEFNLTDGDKLIKRITLLIDLIKKEKKRKAIFPSYKYRKLFSILYIFLAIHLVKIRRIKDSLGFLYKSITTYPLICFENYFFSYIFNLLIKKNVNPN